MGIVVQFLTYIVTKVLDVIWRHCSRGDPAKVALGCALNRVTARTLNVAAYRQLHKIYKDQENLDNLVNGFLTQKTSIIEGLKTRLKSAGLSFGKNEEERLDEICSIFVETFGQELQKAEKLPHSVQQSQSKGAKSADKIDKMYQWMKEERKEPRTPDIKRLVDSVVQKNAAISQLIATEDEEEFEGSKYRRDIEKAKILLDAGKYESSKKIYEKLLEEFKTDNQIPKLAKFKVRNNLGSCQASLGDLPNAAKNFKEAYQVIEGTSVVACKNMALAHSFEGEPEKGLPFVEAALKLSPDDIGSTNIKAMLLRESGRADEALKLYAK